MEGELTLGGDPKPFTDNDRSYYISVSADNAGIEDNGAEITLPILHFTVLTGNDFETAGLFYSNYRLDVEVALCYEGVEIGVTKTSNYVIYTNAKVDPSFLGE